MKGDDERENIDSLLQRVSNANAFASIDEFGDAVRELRERLSAGELPSDLDDAADLVDRMDATFTARTAHVRRCH